jgi:hypothetical protein
MKSNIKFNAKELKKQAETSEDKEAYRQVSKSKAYRMGIGARVASSSSAVFFVEIVVNLSPDGGEVDLESLKKALTVLGTLKKNGYTLTFQDDSCILCEKISIAEDVQREIDAAHVMLEKET